MKSIQNQYNDLKEGKMSQANFMRNLRMTMPQYVTNITSFKDSVRILKNKGLLHESYGGFDEEEIVDEMNMEVKPEESNDAEFDVILKQLEDEMAGEIAVKSDVLDKPLEEAEGVTADAVAVEKAIEDKKIDPAKVKAAAEKGCIDHDAVAMEHLTAIKRAGADIILTYLTRWFAENATK